MKYDFNAENILNLKQKIDALIEKGNDLSINLANDEKYSIMKKLINEGIDKAIQNIYNDKKINFTEKEFKEKKEELKKNVQEYFDKKFSESIAQDWVKNR